MVACEGRRVLSPTRTSPASIEAEHGLHVEQGGPCRLPHPQFDLLLVRLAVVAAQVDMRSPDRGGQVVAGRDRQRRRFGHEGQQQDSAGRWAARGMREEEAKCGGPLLRVASDRLPPKSGERPYLARNRWACRTPSGSCVASCTAFRASVVQALVEGTDLLGVLQGAGQPINQFGLACLHGSADQGEQRLEIVHGQPGERSRGRSASRVLPGEARVFSGAACGLSDESDYTWRIGQTDPPSPAWPCVGKGQRPSGAGDDAACLRGRRLTAAIHLQLAPSPEHIVTRRP